MLAWWSSLSMLGAVALEICAKQLRIDCLSCNSPTTSTLAQPRWPHRSNGTDMVGIVPAKHRRSRF
jgi:hypothetical protein